MFGYIVDYNITNRRNWVNFVGQWSLELLDYSCYENSVSLHEIYMNKFKVANISGESSEFSKWQIVLISNLSDRIEIRRMNYSIFLNNCATSN